MFPSIRYRCIKHFFSDPETQFYFLVSWSISSLSSNKGKSLSIIHSVSKLSEHTAERNNVIGHSLVWNVTTPSPPPFSKFRVISSLTRCRLKGNKLPRVVVRADARKTPFRCTDYTGELRGSVVGDLSTVLIEFQRVTINFNAVRCNSERENSIRGNASLVGNLYPDNFQPPLCSKWKRIVFFDNWYFLNYHHHVVLVIRGRVRSWEGGNWRGNYREVVHFDAA